MMPTKRSKVFPIVLLIFLIGIIFSIVFNFPFNHDKVKIITGPVSGSFYKIALEYQRILTSRGFKVDIEPVANTSELAERVNNSKNVNTISFVIDSSDIIFLKNVRSLGIVGSQPVFIFYNGKNGPMKSLSSLKGRKILLPPKSSITTSLSLNILDMYGINEKNSTIEYTPLAEFYKKITEGNYFACFFQVASDNPLVTDFSLNKDLILYSHENISGILNNIKHLDSAILPAGSFDILLNIPPENVNLLVGNVEVVANKNINKSIIYALLENFDSLHSQRSLISRAGDFPKYTGTSAVLHEIVPEFRKSGTPWIYTYFSSLYALILDNYVIYFVMAFLFVEVYKNLRYLHEFIFLLIEYVSLKIIENNSSRVKSGQRLSYVRQIAQQCAVEVIERKSIRQKAVQMMV